jgi:hypothetical protein
LKRVVWTILAAMFFSGSLNHLVFADSGAPRKDYGCDPTETDYSREEASKCPLQMTDSERYVLDTIRAGKPVKFPKYRELSGCFIKKLLTNPEWKIPPVGVMIDKAIINGPVDLQNTEIPYRVEITCSLFKDDVNLRRSHFAKGLSFAGSTFGQLNGNGRFDAKFAVIGSDFVLNDCTFNNSCTFFNGLRIANDWWLRRAWFAGKADFTGASIGGDLFADRENASDPPTHFHELADFEYVKVAQDCALDQVIFDGFVSFGGAEFKSLSIQKSLFEGNANFKSTKIDSFYMSDAQFEKKLTIEDTTFQYMSPEDWNKLERFAEQSNIDTDDQSYNAQFYSNLEALFRSHGHSDQADEIYIARMKKERDSLKVFGNQGRYWNVVRKSWSYLREKLVGYGRHLEYLLLWCAAFILIGNVVFWREADMKTKKPEDSAQYAYKYSRFWYTMDLFLPFIGLGEADIWTPTRRWAIRYKRLHIIAGQLLVPIGLAVWIGIVK